MRKMIVLVLALVCLSCCLIGGVSATEPSDPTEATELVDIVTDAGIERPFLITPFEEYTVTEGLLLLIFLLLLASFVLNLIWRYF